MHPDTAAVAALLGALGGWFVPALIAVVPEPAEPEEGKEAYADIARLPRLRLGAVLAGLVVGALLGLVLGWTWALGLVLPFVPVGTALTVVDWRTRLLPTKVIAPSYLLAVGLVLLGWALSGAGADVLRAGVGWAVAGGLYFVLWFLHPRGMGYGDVRLSGVIGIVLGYLGWAELLVGVYGGFLLGGLIGGLLAVLRRVDRKGYPFGPFMLLGALVGVLLGEPLLAAVYG